MEHPILITTDLHLDAAPSCAYRWQLFPWLNQQTQQHRVKTLVIMGDLTDAKDNHSAELVNRVVGAISGLKAERIYILAGNHDWLKRGQEFFKFLQLLPAVAFISQPMVMEDCMFLPYSKDCAGDWGSMDFARPYEYIFMHQTIKGAIASNGQVMDGEALPDLSKAKAKIYSGDIHVPQVIGPVEYVGSPYHVHFGDRFNPRCVLIPKYGHPENLHFDTIRRVALDVSGLRDLKRQDLRAGDQVKLRVTMPEAEKHRWFSERRDCIAYLKDHGVSIHGVELRVERSRRRAILGGSPVQGRAKITASDAVLRFVEADELGGDALEAGLRIVEGV